MRIQFQNLGGSRNADVDWTNMCQSSKCRTLQEIAKYNLMKFVFYTGVTVFVYVCQRERESERDVRRERKREDYRKRQTARGK